MTKIKIDKRYKNVVVEVYANEEDEDPQVIIFKGDSVVATKFQTMGRELEQDYQYVEKDVEYDPEKTLVIRAFKKYKNK